MDTNNIDERGKRIWLKSVVMMQFRHGVDIIIKVK